MEDKKVVKKTVVKKVDPKLTVLQACNIHKIIGHYRNHINKKYKCKEFTDKEWKEILKGEGLI